MERRGQGLLRRLDYYANKFGQDLANACATQVATELQKTYNAQGYDYYVEVEKLDKAIRLAVAGEDVMFTEYGTGLQGKGTYPKSHLPKRLLVFESAGEVHATQGWVYHYPNPKTKRYSVRHGEWGWYHAHKFHTGQPAGKQIYDAMKRLKRNLASIAREQIRRNVDE